MALTLVVGYVAAIPVLPCRPASPCTSSCLVLAILACAGHWVWCVVSTVSTLVIEYVVAILICAIHCHLPEQAIWPGLCPHLYCQLLSIGQHQTTMTTTS